MVAADGVAENFGSAGIVSGGSLSVEVAMATSVTIPSRLGPAEPAHEVHDAPCGWLVPVAASEGCDGGSERLQ